MAQLTKCLNSTNDIIELTLMKEILLHYRMKVAYKMENIIIGQNYHQNHHLNLNDITNQILAENNEDDESLKIEERSSQNPESHNSSEVHSIVYSPKKPDLSSKNNEERDETNFDASEEIFKEIQDPQVSEQKMMDDEKEEENIVEIEKSNQPTVGCMICQKEVGDPDEVVYLGQCLHSFCRNCIQNYIHENYSGKSSLKCPAKECNSTIEEMEMTNIVSEKEMDLLQRKFLFEAEFDGNLVECDCKNIIEVVPGEIDYQQKDEKGKQISPESAEHMSLYRVRCNNCNKVFCSKCKENPYHVGFTCEEFKAYQIVPKCRFCKEKILKFSKVKKQAFKNVCTDHECIRRRIQSCDKILKCGHYCCGFKGEKECLPCLNPECVEKNPELTMEQDEDAYCAICYTAGIGEKPSVQLTCRHIFHVDCIIERLTKGSPGPRITFNYCECPSCRKWMDAPHHPRISALINEGKILYETILEKALQRMKFEGLDKDERLSNPEDIYCNKPEKYAMDRISYFMCFTCKTPYFGGLKACENINNDAKEFSAEELICGKCSSKNIKGGVQNCDLHGQEFIEFKCRFCCSVASWFCGGTTHYCDGCHSGRQGPNYNKKCPGKKKCPLKIQHPMNGTGEFALGCALCRNKKEEYKEF